MIPERISIKIILPKLPGESEYTKLNLSGKGILKGSHGNPSPKDREVLL